MGSRSAGGTVPDYLETTFDKFTFRVAPGRLYGADGVWVAPPEPGGGHRVRIGLTDFLQQRSGDVTFLSVKPAGTRLRAGEEVAELETVKVSVSVPVPVGGTIVEVNPALALTPEVVNQDPYGLGWLAVIEASSWEADRAALLDARAYLSVVQGQVERELHER